MRNKHIVYILVVISYLGFISCDDNCPNSTNNYSTSLYEVTRNMISKFKNKSYIVLKNELGDTLILNIKYLSKERVKLLGNTVNKNGEVCTSDIINIEEITVDFWHKDTSYFTFLLSPNYDFVNHNVTKKKDFVDGWKNDLTLPNTGTRILTSVLTDPKISPILHKTVTIHSKNIEVIDTKEKIPEQVFIHEDKGIVAMIIPNHGSGYWVVDKIE